MVCDNYIYLLDNRVVVDVSNDGVVLVLLQPEQSKEAQELIDIIMRFRGPRKNKRHDISMIMNADFGLSLRDIPHKKPRLCLTKNYNDDLIRLHPTLLMQLRRKNESGLILLYGPPGTGKTTYLRLLIHSITKRVIFLQPKMAMNLETPALTDLLINNPNSVLVIEDAEALLVSREQNSESNISMLLNLTDGMLGESLGIHIVATFNTNISNIDKALLRKGRLKALYEFKPLAAAKANALMQEMGISNIATDSPMTLADIYHAQCSRFEFNGVKRPIGFGVSQVKDTVIQ